MCTRRNGTEKGQKIVFLLTWSKSCFRNTQGESDTGKLTPVLRSSGTPSNDTPSDTKSRKIERRSNSSDDEIRWDLEKDIRDEEDKEDDRVLVGREAEFCFKTSCSGVTDVGSVEVG